MINFSLIICSL